MRFLLCFTLLLVVYVLCDRKHTVIARVIVPKDFVNITFSSLLSHSDTNHTSMPNATHEEVPSDLKNLGEESEQQSHRSDTGHTDKESIQKAPFGEHFDDPEPKMQDGKAFENSDDWEEDDSSSKEDFIFNIISIVIASLGAIGNGLVVSTWSKVQQFNNTTFLLAVLGVADLAFVLTMIVVNIFFLVKESYGYATNWVFFLAVYASYVAQYVSIFITVLVSITRYAAVKFPFKVQVWFRKSNIQTVIAVIVCFSVLAAFPATSNLCLFMYIFNFVDYKEGSAMSMQTPNYGRQHNVTNDKNVLNTDNNQQMLTIDNITFRRNASAMRLFIPMSSTLPPSDDGVDLGGSSGFGAYYSYDVIPEKEIEVCTFMAAYSYSFPLLTAILVNIVPWLIVLPMNFLLVNQVRKVFAKRKQQLRKEDQGNNTMDIVIIILTLQSIVAYPMFFIAELLTNKIDWEYFFGGQPPFPIDDLDSHKLTTWRDCFQMLNSSVNIIAYCLCGNQFRRLLLEKVLKCKKTHQGKSSKNTRKQGIESSDDDNIDPSFSSSRSVRQTQASDVY